MQRQKCSLDLYVDFLVASQKQFSGMELSKVAPESMAHDAVSRWLAKEKLTPARVWQVSQALVDRQTGYLILDDTLLDKPYASKMALVKRQYSGKHHRVVQGIALVNLLWTDGTRIVPVDYRVYAPAHDGKTKNDHGREMIGLANQREFRPGYVLLDSWYTGVDNLKMIAPLGWNWIGELKANRLVSLQQGEYLAVADLDWTDKPVHKVWLKAYGFVQVSQTVTPNGDVAYLATNDLSLSEAETLKDQYAHRWTIELFHRGIKQCCGIERCYSVKERSQRNHILCAFLAFLKLEWQRLQTAVSWYDYKWSIARRAVTAYLC